MQGPPVGVIIIGRGIDSSDAHWQVLEVDDVRFPRCADVVVTDKLLCVIDDNDFVVDADAECHRLTCSLTSDDEVVETIGGSTCGTTTLIANEGSHLKRIHHGRAVHNLDDHRHVVWIEVSIYRCKDVRRFWSTS